MAMTKCKECKNVISTKAKQCPNCGAKVPKQVGLGGIILVAFVGWIIYTVASVDTNTSPSQSSRTPSSSSSSKPNSAPAKPRPVWSTQVSVDEMTGKREAYATSVRVPPTKRMDFPYADVKAWMGVGCDGSSEWAYFGFSSSPNITNDKTESGYNVINTRVKWDDSIQNTRLIQEWGAKSIHFSNKAAAIAKIAGSSSVMLELSWHGQGSVNFLFPLEGSSAAIQEMREKCK